MSTDVTTGNYGTPIPPPPPPPPSDDGSVPTPITGQAGTGQTTTTGQTGTTSKTGAPTTDTTSIGVATDIAIPPPPTGSPVIPPPDSNSPNSPPTGAGGSGNPFFNTNPMVAITIAFTNMEEVLSYTAFVMNQIALLDMQGTKDAGKSQAQGIIQAGQANYNAEMAQGITSAFMAGFSLLQVGLSVYAFKSAKADLAKEEANVESKATSDTKKLNDYKEANPEKVEINEKVKVEKQQLVKLQKEQNDATVEIKKMEDDPTSTDFTAEIRQKETEKLARTKNIQSLKSDIAVKEDKLTDLRSLEKEQMTSTKELKDFQVKRAHNFATLIQQNQVKAIGDLIIGGVLTKTTESFQQIFSADAHLKAAYWNAYSQMASTQKEIISKGMDFSFQQWQSLNDEFSKMTQTLGEIYQKHASSFMFR